MLRRSLAKRASFFHGNSSHSQASRDSLKSQDVEQTRRILSHQSVSLRFLKELVDDIASKRVASDVELFVALRDLGADIPTGTTIRRVATLQNGKVKGTVDFVPGTIDFVPGRDAREKPRAEWSTEDVAQRVVLAATQQLRGSQIYLDIIGDTTDVGDEFQGIFVSQARKCCFADLIQALDMYFAENEDDTEPFVWLDLFCANQPLLLCTDEDLPAEVLASRERILTEGLHEAIARFNHTVVFFDRWDRPAPLQRAWCVWEILGSVNNGQPARVIYADGQESDYITQLLEDPAQIARVMADNMDMRKARCWKPEDERRISNAIKRTLENGFVTLNSVINEQVRTWLLGMARQAIATARTQSDELYLASLLAQTGFLADSQGYYQDALSEFYMEALEIRRRVLGPSDHETANTLVGIGNVYTKQGYFAEALQIFNDALVILQEGRGSRTPAVANVLNSIARVHFRQKKYEDALTFYKDALAIYRASLGAKLEKVAITLIGIADVRHAQGKNEKALRNYNQARSIIVNALGERHPLVATALHNIAKAYASQQDFEQALQVYHEALEVRQEALGSRHPAVAETLNGIALVLHQTGEHDEALEKYFEALDIRREALGPRHKAVASVLCHIADVHRDLHNFGVALEYYREARSVYLGAVTPSQLELAALLVNMGNIFTTTGQFARALHYYEDALPRCKGAAARLLKAQVLDKIAGVQCAQRKYVDALKNYEAALEIRRQHAEDFDLDMVYSLRNVASLHQRLRHYNEALALLNEAFEVLEQIQDVYPAEFARASGAMRTVPFETQEGVRRRRPGAAQDFASSRVFGNFDDGDENDDDDAGEQPNEEEDEEASEDVDATWRYYDEDGHNPFRRFLRPDNPEHLYPTRRFVLFLFLGSCLSTVGVQISADQYYEGPQQQHVIDFHWEQASPLHIAFENIGCSINGVDHTILSNVSGEVQPGRLMGIMGPSGSGKTTLSWSLLGRGKRYCTGGLYGDLYLNGRPRNLESFLDRVGFVPQDDVLCPDLTVEEILHFSASWRLPRDLSEEDRQQVVEDVMETLDLVKVRDRRVGGVNKRGISGGERKRTSIGMELVANPAVLIMDEPTSGLDSAGTFRLMSMLKRIADRNVSVVTVIHQPSARVFSLLDDLVLMQEGEAAYVGPREGILDFLDQMGYNVPGRGRDGINADFAEPPAEFILDVAARLEQPSRPPELGGGRRIEDICAEHDQEFCLARADGQRHPLLPVLFREVSQTRGVWTAIEERMRRDRRAEDAERCVAAKADSAKEEVLAHSEDRAALEALVVTWRAECQALPDDQLMQAAKGPAEEDSSSSETLLSSLVEMLCDEESTALYCAFLEHRDALLPSTQQRTKPGLKRQVQLWFWRNVFVLKLRRGIAAEVASVASLALVVSFVRSFNKTWNRRAVSNLFLSISIGLLGMVGAVFNDDVAYAKRAAAAGMLLGAHEFAVLAESLLWGWFVSHVYSFSYFVGLWARTGVWVIDTPAPAPAGVSKFDLAYWVRLQKYYEFAHLLHLNYLTSQAIGQAICVFANHATTVSYIGSMATLIGCHVFAFFTPNQNQIQNDSILFGTINIAPVVERVCSVSYVRFFLEAIFLWDPSPMDPGGRSYVLRYFGYHDSDKTTCATSMFSLWTLMQAVRFVVFGLRNSNDFHSLHDTPLFLIFIFKVLSCHVVALLIMTLIQECSSYTLGLRDDLRRPRQELGVRDLGELVAGHERCSDGLGGSGGGPARLPARLVRVRHPERDGVSTIIIISSSQRLLEAREVGDAEPLEARRESERGPGLERLAVAGAMAEPEVLRDASNSAAPRGRRAQTKKRPARNGAEAVQWSQGDVLDLAASQGPNGILEAFQDGLGNVFEALCDEDHQDAGSPLASAEIAQLVSKPSKLGMVLATLAQTSCKTLASSTESDTTQDHATVALFAVRMVMRIRASLTFKHPLAPESLCQKLVGACTEAKCFETAISASDLVLASLIRSDHLSLDEDQTRHDMGEAPVCCETLRLGTLDDAKVVGITVFTIYNCVRALVELGRSDEALLASSTNLAFWLRELARNDQAKTFVFLKAHFSLFYHHGASRCETVSDAEKAFRYRIEALRTARGSVPHATMVKSKLDVALIERLLGACNRYAREGSSPTETILEALDELEEDCVLELAAQDPLASAYVQFYREVSFQSIDNIEPGIAMFARWFSVSTGNLQGVVILSALMSIIEWTLATRRKIPPCSMSKLLQVLGADAQQATSALPALCDALKACASSCQFDDQVHGPHLARLLEKELLVQAQRCAKTKHAQLHAVLASMLAFARTFAPQALFKARLAGLKVVLERSAAANDVDAALSHLAEMQKIARQDESLGRSVANAAYNVGARFFNEASYESAVTFLQVSTQLMDSSSSSTQVSLGERFKILAVCLQRAERLADARDAFARAIAAQVAEGEIPDVTAFCRCTQALVEAGEGHVRGVMADISDAVDLESNDQNMWTRIMLRTQLDAFMSLGDPSLADALVDDARARCVDAPERALIDIEHARYLVVRSIGLDKLPGRSDNTHEDDGEESKMQRLARAAELCGEALEVSEDEGDTISARFWLGACEQVLEGLDEGICAAVDLWAARDEAGLDYCAIQDVGFAGEWCEVIGLHEASFRARAVFIRAARGADPVRLVQIAAHKESRLGVALLARLLYEQSDRLDETLAAVVAAKFYKLGYMTRIEADVETARQCKDRLVLADDEEEKGDDTGKREGTKSQTERSTGLGEFVGVLESRVHDAMASLDPDEQADEYATCTFLLASLAFASTTDSALVLDTAVKALKLRATCQEAPEGPLAVTGLNWKHVNDVVDCLELLCEIHLSRGDPRTARYYVERGRTLAERVGSDALLNRFQMLKGRVALLCGKPDDAEELLGSMKREQSRKVALQLVLSRASVALARRDGDAAAELVDDAEHAWRAFVDQTEGGRRLADQDEEVIAKLSGLDLAGASLSPPKGRARERCERSRLSVFADEARIQLLGLQGRLAVLQNQDPTRWLTKAAALGEGNAVLERHVCRAKVALGQAYFSSQSWAKGRATLENALESAVRVDASPETGRSLFRALAAARVRAQDTETWASSDWETAAMVHASFGMALSLERMRIWASNRCHELHMPWKHSLELGDAFARVCAGELPSTMTVCSIAALDDLGVLVVSRLTSSGQPLTLVLPLEQREEDLAVQMQDLIDAAEQTTKGTTVDSTASWDRSRKREWWTERKRLDQDLEQLLDRIEAKWLGPAAIALLAPTASALKVCEKTLESLTRKQLSGAGVSTKGASMEIFKVLVLAVISGAQSVVTDIVIGVREVAEKLASTSSEEKSAMATGKVQAKPPPQREAKAPAGFEPLPKAPSAMKVVELRAALADRGLRTSGLKKDLIARLEAFETDLQSADNGKELDTEDSSDEGDAGNVSAKAGAQEDEDAPNDMSKEGSLILVLDETLQGIPFEAMPALRKRCVSRMPSFAFIAERLKSLKKGVNVHGATYMVDPRGDLSGTAKTLAPFLESAGSRFGWHGSVGKLKSPSKGTEMLKQGLAESPVFLYCGHGSGEELLAREQLAQLDSCATSLLMGCSSGKLRAQGIFEPAGVVLAYVLAGSSAVVANLWDVTDKDIDRFTLAMLNAWLDDGQRLPAAVQDARESCKLRFLVGAAPVCIGVPLAVSRQ
ncbi:ABC transporter G family member 22 [Hondaea fermentalgiana]|uniref:separase n=1 Tax=Hondaea fermentalgiana TaxID=2315210 RepID=A0A2R5GVC1_9STRA|nr:ABC transporter G family member 22 [Hondaea fermentalgiana]|eukprot:GBG34802.1 ABC transporter G family member 22 [Hondaea fermentalgiana]